MGRRFASGEFKVFPQVFKRPIGHFRIGMSQNDRAIFMSDQEFLIALGSNLSSHAGSSEETISLAIRRFSANDLQPMRVSRYFATACFPAGAGPDYVNAAASIRADCSPLEVLTRLHKIELEFDRQRQNRWAARTLDLDLLAVGGAVLPDDATFAQWYKLPAEEQGKTAPNQLILPHPRMQDRAFVLVPLCDVAADWRHPVLGRTVRQMRDALPKSALDEVRPLI